nr:EOG090X07VJ [Cyclestheria hislopi]
MLAPPYNPLPKTEIQFDDTSGPMNILIACGPFTLSEDLDFAPLEALVQQINQMEPHVVIFLGPFLDTKNRKVESGELGRTYEEEFDDLVEKLAAHIDSSVQMILVPSWRDCHHHPVYPTSPYQFKRNISNIRSVSDPCILNISGCVIALTSTDILFHLGKEEIAVAPAGSDRLARLSSHLLNQQCFYPLYPPAEDMSIDFEHWDTYCRLPLTPHLLVIPSDLRYFIKNIEGCTVVNPERLAKGTSGGTFSRLQVKNQGNSVTIEAEIVRI